MIIYTDGATSNNGYENAVGGWAFIVIENNTIIHQESGKCIPATNNICELTAAINACNYAYHNSPETEKVEIYTDSAYIANCYKDKWYKKWQLNGWRNSKKEPVANQSLWNELVYFFNIPRFSFIKTKGHSTDVFNNMVDKLAVEAKLND